MFSDTKAFSSFSVDDTEKAKQFYGQTLGLKVTEKMELLFLHLSGGTEVMIYPKPDHVPAEFTVLNFRVKDIEAAMEALVAKGVDFERYETMGADEKGIFRDRELSIAWFKDPAGNVLSIWQED